MGNDKKDIPSLLESSFLFSGLNTRELQNLAEKSRIFTYNKGQILIEEDIASERIIYIISGLVKVYKITPDGKEVFIAIERDGNYLGVMNLDDKPGSATIETLQTTKVLMFHKKDLQTILKNNPVTWERMYKIVLAKLKEFNELYSIRVGHDLYERTYLLLEHLAKLSSDRTVVLSQEALANIIGATRPRVTEALNTLSKEKKISISPRKIIVL